MLGTDGEDVYFSSNNGKTWTGQINGFPSNTIVRSLAINGSYVFAGTYGADVYFSSNNGSTWAEADNAAFAFDASDIYALTIISNGDIFAGTSLGIYMSPNNGASWSTMNIGITTNEIDAFTINGNNIFAGSYGGGVFLSTNTGGSWSKVNTGLTNDTINTLITSDSSVFAGTNNGVYISTNNGGIWTAVNYGLPINTKVLSFSINADTLFAGTKGLGVWKQSLSDITTVGIKEINSNASNIAVYPNPAINNLTIESPQSAVIEMTNIQGQLIKVYCKQAAI